VSETPTADKDKAGDKDGDKDKAGEDKAGEGAVGEDGGDEEATDAPPELLHGCPVGESAGQRVVYVDRARYLEVFRALYQDGYDLCSDVTAVDYIAHPGRPLPDPVTPERFEVVVNLLDRGTGPTGVAGGNGTGNGTSGNGAAHAARPPRRLRARCQVPASDPTVPSLFDVWPGSDAMEREVFDLMGIVFEGHPDLSRILMPDDWEGHPLRKDNPVGRVPVQFKEAPPPR
jgi:NADH-quinone oxidoreductase subunit C